MTLFLSVFRKLVKLEEIKRVTPESCEQNPQGCLTALQVLFKVTPFSIPTFLSVM